MDFIGFLIFYSAFTVTLFFSVSKLVSSSLPDVSSWRMVYRNKLTKADKTKIAPKRIKIAPGKVSNVILYNCLKRGFPAIGTSDAKIDRIENTFPTSSCSIHLDMSERTTEYLQ